MLEIFFVGTGSAFATQNYNNSILIRKNGSHILVDCGENGPLALNSHGIDPGSIRNIFITHLHSDHVAGVPHLALKNYYIGRRLWGGNQPKLRMIVNEHMQQLMWDKALSAGLMYNELVGEETKRPMTFSDYFDVVRPEWKKTQPREVWEVDVDAIHLEIFRTVHIPEQAPTWQAAFPSFGLFIDGKVFYSSDTKFDPELIEMYNHAQVFFHDVQFFKGGVHASLEELKTLPLHIKRRMYLMHYPDNYKEHDISGFRGWAEQGNVYINDQFWGHTGWEPKKIKI